MKKIMVMKNNVFVKVILTRIFRFSNNSGGIHDSKNKEAT